MKWTIFKLFLIPDDGVSSIDSDHLGVLDNRFVTAFLAEEGCHKYARVGSFNSILFYREPGSSDSIVIVSIILSIFGKSWEWQFFRVYLPCIDVTNLDLLEH